jgi:hypothetical protein
MARPLPSLALCLFALLALAAAPGCQRPFTAVTPAGFVELNNQRARDYDYRATTPDGVVLGVRAIAHDPPGDLSFWARSVENHLRQVGGYASRGKRNVTCQGGLTGVELRFGHDEGTQPHHYRVSLFVTPKWIYLLEVGGHKARVEQMDRLIDRWVADFDPGRSSSRP